jgi:FemAB-related protein (PEP-CTERM system-associated)
MLDQVNDHRSASACTVKHLGHGEETRWDAFVSATPAATFFHRAAWRDVIENELGHRCHYLYAERNGLITGVLPLAEIRSWLFGHALISTPFCIYGGVAATDAESEARLTEAATELAQELRVDYLELRDREPRHPTWPVKDLYVSFHKEISADSDKNFMAIPGKRRNIVRKAIKLGLEAHQTEDMGLFYRIYAESVRNLGTPVLPRSYYARLQQAFGEDCEITVVTDQGEPVAVGMNFYDGDEIHPYYGGSVRRARVLPANDLLYWAVMQRAAERGVRQFDAGRSKRNSGSYDFKMHWGFEAKPLPYAYHLVRAKEMPNISPANSKYSLFIKAWQRLPLPVAGVLGPWVARDLG